MDIEARQLALRNFEAAKRASTESRRLLEEARKETMRAPGTRAAVLAQRAYENRLNAEVTKFRAVYSMLAAEEGEKAESAAALSKQVRNAERQRTYQLNSQHAQRRRDLMLQASEEMSKALKNLPGLSAAHRPPSGQQTTIGATESFRSPEFLARFSAFFPSDIRSAASVGQGNGLSGFDAVADCEVCMRRDLDTVNASCRTLTTKMGNGDPAVSALVQRANALAASLGALGSPSGLGSDSVSVGVRVAEVTSKNRGIIIPALLIGSAGYLAYKLFARS
jgi:hypothetical protein